MIVFLKFSIPDCRQTGIRSKFRKVFPFKFAKDNKPIKSGGKENSSTSSMICYLGSTSFCAVAGTALPNDKVKSIMKPSQVPK